MKAYFLYYKNGADEGVAVIDTFTKRCGLFMEFDTLSLTGQWQPWVTLDLEEAAAAAVRNNGSRHCVYWVRDIEIGEVEVV